MVISQFNKWPHRHGYATEIGRYELVTDYIKKSQIEVARFIVKYWEFRISFETVILHSQKIVYVRIIINVKILNKHSKLTVSSI